MLEQITTDMDVQMPGKKKSGKLASMKKKYVKSEENDKVGFEDWKFKNSRNGYIAKGEIIEMPGRVMVSKGAKQKYVGKDEPEAKRPLISGTSEFKKVNLK